MLANKQGAGEAPIIGKQPEAVVPVVPPDEPLTRPKSTSKSTATLIAEAATSAAKQKDEQREGKVPAKSPSKTLAQTLARASRSQGAAQQEIKSESGPVEDLDELHTLQVSLWPLAAVTNPVCQQVVLCSLLSVSAVSALQLVYAAKSACKMQR